MASQISYCTSSDVPPSHAHLPFCGPTHHLNILAHHLTQVLSGQGTPKSLHPDKTAWRELAAPFSPVSPSSAALMKTRGPEKRGVLARAIQGRIYMILEAELKAGFPVSLGNQNSQAGGHSGREEAVHPRPAA